MDALSDVLSLLKPQGYLTAALDAGDNWAVRFGNQAGVIKCHVVLEGGCWIVVDGERAVQVEAGDCIMLISGRSFTLASDLEQVPVSAAELLGKAKPGDTVTLDGGGAFRLIGTRFLVDADKMRSLLGDMPALVHLQGAAHTGMLRWNIEQMIAETSHSGPGTALAAHHLAHLILLQALRLFLSKDTETRTGVLFAMSDKRLAKAIEAMHSEPGHSWTLPELAVHAGLSRSAFAQRFCERTGETPIAYLTRWRMLLATERLQCGTERLGEIANSLGYESENAFSTAFKRVTGYSPTQIGRVFANPYLQRLQ
jgi:AraC-like DNA-binding protein